MLIWEWQIPIVKAFLLKESFLLCLSKIGLFVLVCNHRSFKPFTWHHVGAHKSNETPYTSNEEREFQGPMALIQIWTFSREERWLPFLDSSNNSEDIPPQARGGNIGGRVWSKQEQGGKGKIAGWGEMGEGERDRKTRSHLGEYRERAAGQADWGSQLRPHHEMFNLFW